MKTFSALLAFCVGNSPVAAEFPAQMPVMRNFDVLFDLRLKQQLIWDPLPSLWRHEQMINPGH